MPWPKQKQWRRTVAAGNAALLAERGYPASLRRLSLNLFKRNIKGKQLNTTWNHDYRLRLHAF